MTPTATPRGRTDIASRASMLKGAILHLLDDAVSDCCNRGLPCSEALRQELHAQLAELAGYAFTDPIAAGLKRGHYRLLTYFAMETERQNIRPRKLELIHKQFKEIVVNQP